MWEAGVDVAISASMDVDHGTVQPLREALRRRHARPVIPIFINSVATPLGPLKRSRALGAAVGEYLATLDKRVLVIGSGGLSHDPPVPTLATAPPAALERIVHGGADDAPRRGWPGRPAVIDGRTGLRPRREPAAAVEPGLGPTLLEILDAGRLTELDGWSNAWIAARGRQLGARDPHLGGGFRGAGRRRARTETEQRYYRAAPELIAGFAIRTAVAA